MLSIRGGRQSLQTKKKLVTFWRDIEYLIIDEMSMLSKSMLAKLSRIIAEAKGMPDEAFSGVSVCLSGDIHQFPPVASSPLYWPINPCKDKDDTLIGGRIYQQFQTVVQLRTQMRTDDKVWHDVLQHVRYGNCCKSHLETLRSLIISNPKCPHVDFSSTPWNETVLITPRHAVRKHWSSAMCTRESKNRHVPLFRCVAEDTVSGQPLSPRQRHHMVTSKSAKSRDERGGLPEIVEVFVGMKVMVTFNIAVDLDIANGSRGEVIDIILDEREEQLIPETGVVELKYPPSYVLVRLNHTRAKQLDGLPENVLPLVPMSRSFTFQDPTFGKTIVTRKQLPLTASYALTDYRGQGQTLYPVIVDIGNPPTGHLTGFNAYVALSRGRGRDSIRLLQDFDDTLLTVHASEYLRQEDLRLHSLDQQTQLQWTEQQNRH